VLIWLEIAEQSTAFKEDARYIAERWSTLAGIESLSSPVVPLDEL
jgi:hypothetical protein